MAIFGANRRGDRYAVSYTIGDEYNVRNDAFDIVNVASIEGHINSRLAEKHNVPVAQVHIVGHIIRINE
jgi:hypothetical protein